MAVEELVSVVRKTRVFLYNLHMSIIFMVFGGLYTGYWLVVASLPDNFITWVLAGIGAFILAVICIYIAYRVTPPITPGYKVPDRVSERFIVAFVTPFIISYSVILQLLDNLGVKIIDEIANVIWYPSLGVGLLLAHLLFERVIDKLNPGLVKSRPYLYTGLSITVSSPIPLAIAILGYSSGWYLALGFTILSYTAAVHAMYKALAAFRVEE